MFKIVNVYQRKLNLLNSREWAIKLVLNSKIMNPSDLVSDGFFYAINLEGLGESAL